jgi:hypothetical protein
MAVTIDSISHRRFGINIISGWQRRQTGIRPRQIAGEMRWLLSREATVPPFLRQAVIPVARKLWLPSHLPPAENLVRTAATVIKARQRCVTTRGNRASLGARATAGVEYAAATSREKSVGHRPADAIGLDGLHSRNGDGAFRKAANSSA